ncbi:hypothetical protein OG496_10545 [Streptomyces sp. NBC_00988]|uniref:hypothetical protein n=1 Tax=Streptomyces sp. NBC_00988 TaxID=2903704 RepID=UPI00386E81E3|nr:hypothetical protein OG496_10545 [Streptomyces sp. NBC_00988]
MLADLWLSDAEIQQLVDTHVTRHVCDTAYAHILDGDERWTVVPAATGQLLDWAPKSTYLRRPPFLDGVATAPPQPADVLGTHVLVVLGDSVTTDHTSPAGHIPADGCAGRSLTELGGIERDTCTSRRGNFEVMVRGGFANPRQATRLAPGGEARPAASSWTVMRPCPSTTRRSPRPRPKRRCWSSPVTSTGSDPLATWLRRPWRSSASEPW